MFGRLYSSWCVAYQYGAAAAAPAHHPRAGAPCEQTWINPGTGDTCHDSLGGLRRRAAISSADAQWHRRGCGDTGRAASKKNPATGLQLANLSFISALLR